MEDYLAPEEYGEKHDWCDPRSFDYALLKLKKPVEESDFLELCPSPEEIEKDSSISIYGYPVSKYEMKNNLPKASKQYGLERKGYILSMYIEAGYIVHRISAEPGQSGAPVISTNEKGESTIVGIHIASTENNI